MRYRIEYADKGCCDFANGRDDLIKRLGTTNGRTITDVRKLFKSGVSDSVMDIYKRYISKGRCGNKRIDRKIEEIKIEQAELVHRTKVENEAEKLVCQCRFEEAIKLLATL